MKITNELKAITAAIYMHVVASLWQEQLTRVLDAMFERKVTPDDHVIDQGDDGDNFYVVDR